MIPLILQPYIVTRVALVSYNTENVVHNDVDEVREERLPNLRDPLVVELRWYEESFKAVLRERLAQISFR
jgi:hypothetical protein